MASIIKVDDVQDAAGNNIINESGDTITIGASGDTITIPSGATISNSGTATGFGKVLQAVATQGGNNFSTTSASFVDVTGMSLTITPAASSSKILLLCNTNTYQTTDVAYFAMRYERAISGGATTAFGHATYGQSYARAAQDHDFWGGVGMTYLDSPSTTSEITYQVQASTTGSGTVSIGVNTAVNQNTIIAIEIGA
jgi:hypothetical protein